MAKWRDQDKRISAYKEADIDDASAHGLIIRATDVGVCNNRLIPSGFTNGASHAMKCSRNVMCDRSSARSPNPSKMAIPRSCPDVRKTSTGC